MWFTAFDQIGRITANGAITEFPIPTPAANSFPDRIAAGPDGNMWYTDGLANTIGRITPAGTITEFRIPTPDSDPHRIAKGPDGALWFTQGNINMIGRITPAGAVTEFRVPLKDGVPLAIAAGPDGNIWFTEYVANKIVRLTPRGKMTAFPVPSAGGPLNGIAAGPDDDIWFTGAGENKIGLIGAGPPDVKISRATVSSPHRSATFRFKAIGSPSFQCSLAPRSARGAPDKPHFTRCTSPKTYKHLRSGKYTFEVRALSAAGYGTPAGNSFEII